MPAPNNAIPWVVGLVFLSLFLFFATANWMIVWAALFRKKHSSWVPLVGGLFGVAAFRFLPFARLHSYWWLPLILGYGCLAGPHMFCFWTLPRLGHFFSFCASRGSLRVPLEKRAISEHS